MVFNLLKKRLSGGGRSHKEVGRQLPISKLHKTGIKSKTKYKDVAPDYAFWALLEKMKATQKHWKNKASQQSLYVGDMRDAVNEIETEIETEINDQKMKLVVGKPIIPGSWRPGIGHKNFKPPAQSSSNAGMIGRQPQYPDHLHSMLSGEKQKKQKRAMDEMLNEFANLKVVAKEYEGFMRSGKGLKQKRGSKKKLGSKQKRGSKKKR